MSLLNDQIEQQIRQAFEALTGPVKIVLFTQGENALECAYCVETRQLLEEISALSDKITLDVYDFVHDAKLAEQYHIDKIPAVAILSGGATPKDHGIRLYGVPAGYEFSTLIEDILMVSQQKSALNARTLDELKKLTQPVNIQVFVTPTLIVSNNSARVAPAWIASCV
jgi:glutaredoxin-like protein